MTNDSEQESVEILERFGKLLNPFTEFYVSGGGDSLAEARRTRAPKEFMRLLRAVRYRADKIDKFTITSTQIIGRTQPIHAKDPSGAVRNIGTLILVITVKIADYEIRKPSDCMCGDPDKDRLIHPHISIGPPQNPNYRFCMGGDSGTWSQISNSGDYTRAFQFLMTALWTITANAPPNAPTLWSLVTETKGSNQ